jgi:hypothetical protein
MYVLYDVPNKGEGTFQGFRRITDEEIHDLTIHGFNTPLVPVATRGSVPTLAF